jgi:hypothetical protein
MLAALADQTQAIPAFAAVTTSPAAPVTSPIPKLKP